MQGDSGQWRAGDGVLTRELIRTVAAAILVLVAGCTGSAGGSRGSTGGATDTTTGAGSTTGSAGACASPGLVTAFVLLDGGMVREAFGGDLNADGHMDLVIEGDTGVTAFLASSCGAPGRPMTALSGTTLTGVAGANLDGKGGLDVATFDGQFDLQALSGDELDPLWSSTMKGLASAGPIIAAQLHVGPLQDIVAFDAKLANLLRVANTGSGWSVKDVVTLPAGISRVEAGNLEGVGRDVILFMGDGLVEVVSTADYNYNTDVRLLLESGDTTAVAFGDFSGDGKPDLAVADGSTVELWKGNGSGTVTLGPKLSLPNRVVDLAAVDRTGTGPLEIAAVDDEGVITVIDGSGGSLVASGTASTDSHALRLAAGDLDGDGKQDLVVLTTDGLAYEWITP